VDTWTITINGSELREVGIAEAIRGDALTWKLAMWGSYRDRRVVESVKARFREETVATIAERRGLRIHEGFQPRKRGKHVPELLGEKRIKQNAVRGLGDVFAFPDCVFEEFPAELAYARPGRDKLPVAVSRPPHILCDAARRFAVYSDDFVAVRARQPAIAGPKDQADFLKVLSLYLSSDFAKYHQFLISAQWGISFNRASLSNLKALPVPLANLTAAEFSQWLDLHARLAAASPAEPPKKAKSRRVPALPEQKSFPDMAETPSQLPGLIRELNKRVCKLLRLRKSERILVEDFVQFKRFAIKGKFSRETAGVPEPEELEKYGAVLQAELDGFFEGNPRPRHKVDVLYDRTSRTGMVDVELLKNSRGPLPVSARPVDDATSADFQRAQSLARQSRGQWLCFQRNLRIYEGSHVLLLKPLERLHWLRSQALLDADTIIAENAAGGGK
jgi:hypothetical protein